jgi:hypothetical protein
MTHFALILCGALLCNSIPHVTAGLQGTPFPTPFAKPRGIGNSSPFVNFLWGAFNAIAGVLLLARWPITVGANLHFLCLMTGVLLSGGYASIHFGKVPRGRTGRRRREGVVMPGCSVGPP